MKTEMVNLLKTLGIGGFGGAAHYLFQFSKGEKFHFGNFCVNIIIAAFVGWLMGSFIPEDLSYRDGIIGVSGAASLQIMAALQSNGIKVVAEALIKVARVLLFKK